MAGSDECIADDDIEILFVAAALASSEVVDLMERSTCDMDELTISDEGRLATRVGCIAMCNDVLDERGEAYGWWAGFFKCHDAINRFNDCFNESWMGVRVKREWMGGLEPPKQCFLAGSGCDSLKATLIDDRGKLLKNSILDKSADIVDEALECNLCSIGSDATNRISFRMGVIDPWNKLHCQFDGE